MTTGVFVALAALLVLGALGWLMLIGSRSHSNPHIAVGNTLPRFTCRLEDGSEVSSDSLAGKPSVLVFVRGSWCPFCSRQVKNLTGYYKDIVDLGAKLILVTPKPLATTQRVAEFFDMEFEFWLDESLTATRELGLLLESAVPKDYYPEYGSDTTWPTSLVIDAAGVIRYVELSKHIIDRPNPKTLLRELQKAIPA